MCGERLSPSKERLCTAPQHLQASVSRGDVSVFPPAQRLAQRGKGHIICVLFSLALLSNTSQLQCSGTCSLQLIPESVDLVSSRKAQCSCFQAIRGCHLSQSSPPGLTFRPGTSQGSGRSSQWPRGCRFPHAGRAWTRRDCPQAHSAHQRTARGRCRCNLERVRVNISVWKNGQEQAEAVPGAAGPPRGLTQLPKHRYPLLQQVLWDTQAIPGGLVGSVQDLVRLLEAGWPLWGNTVALGSCLSNKSRLSTPDRSEISQGIALLHGEAEGHIWDKGRGTWLADSQFLTLLSAIPCNLLFSGVFGPASSRGMKCLSQHAEFLLLTGDGCS